MITTKAGHAVTVATIEKELKVSPYIADAVLFGEGRAFMTCLVMIEQDTVEAWAHASKVPFTSFSTLARAEKVRALIGREIDQAASRLGQPGIVGAFRLIERKLEPDDPELTPMMKLRRGFVGETYGELIEEMYSGA